MIDTEDLRSLADMMEWRDFPESHVKVRKAADEIDRQAALIAKYEEALCSIKRCTNVCYVDASDALEHIERIIEKTLKRILEDALKGDSNQ